MKKSASTHFILCIFFFFFAFNVEAAPLQGFISDCLDGVITENEYTGKLTFPPYEKSKIAPKNDVKTWIFSCISTDEGQKCTTGDRAVDIELFGTAAAYDDLSKLLIPPPTPTPFKNLGVPATIGGIQEQISETYVKGANPKKTTLFMVHPGFKELTNIETVLENAGYGKDIYWYDAYPVIGGVTHSWYWLQELQPITTSEVAGSEASQKLGKFSFTQMKSDIDCSKVQWDPMGFVFDAATLYPVKGVSILLSQQQKDSSFITVPNGLGVTNPFTTLETNGQYSFIVPAGFYKMSVNSSNASIASVVNNSKAQEIFGPNIYTPNMIVEEVEGKIAVSHIPVSVSNTDLLVKEIALLDHQEEGLASGNLGLNGRLTHPKSIIKLLLSYKNVNGQNTIKKEQHFADSLGVYHIVIPQTEESRYLTEISMSYSLNTDIYPDAAESQIKPIIVKPIPSYIEGIAYDKKNTAISNAIVGLYPTFSEKPMYLTIADAQGRFKIGSQHVPRFQYNLRYKSTTGEVIQIDTKTFILQNTTFFSKEKINPYVSKKTSLKEDLKVQQFFEKNEFPPSLDISRKTSERDLPDNTLAVQKNNKQNSPLGVIVIFVVLLIGGIGVFVWIKTKKKKTL